MNNKKTSRQNLATVTDVLTSHVSCKWVFKVKQDAKGEVQRFKTRLVAKRFNQKYGQAYDEIFAS